MAKGCKAVKCKVDIECSDGERKSAVIEDLRMVEMIYRYVELMEISRMTENMGGLYGVDSEGVVE